jgi:hypothetical protein
MQMLTQGAEYRIKEGLPQGCVLLGTEMKGNVVVMRVQSVEFSQTDERDPEIDIKVDLHTPGRGWS